MVLLLAAAPMLSGCSLLFVRAPSPADSDLPPRCTESQFAPLLDWTVAAGAAALGAYVSSRCAGGQCESAAPVYVLSTALVVVPVGVASGIVGLKRTADCADAWRSWCASNAALPAGRQECGFSAPSCAGLNLNNSPSCP